MTTNEINIQIAKIMGWGDIQPCTCSEDKPRGVIPGGGDFRHIPDFTKDLNAVHEAEKSIQAVSYEDTRRLWLTYIIRLREIITIIHPKSDTEHEWLLIRATARQRAEAFLATMAQGSATEAQQNLTGGGSEENVGHPGDPSEYGDS